MNLMMLGLTNFIFSFIFFRPALKVELHPFGGEKIMICADALVQYVYTEPLLYEIHAVPTRGSVQRLAVQGRSFVASSSYL